MMKKQNILIIIGIAVVVLVVGLVLLSGKKIVGNKEVGYVTIDINNDSIKLSYDKDSKITEGEYKGSLITEGIDKYLSKYKDGTIILIGLKKDEVSKVVEKYFIEEYPGIDRHTLKFIYLENDELGKDKLTKALGMDSNISVMDIFENNDANNYISEMENLEGYHTRD